MSEIGDQENAIEAFRASKFNVCNPSYVDIEGAYVAAWFKCAELKGRVIEQQAKELEALRAFAKDLFIDEIGCDGHPFINEMLVKHRLIDESGNLTNLLTGKLTKE